MAPEHGPESADVATTAEDGGAAAPLWFAGTAYERGDVPDAWYGCLSEWELVAFLKQALRERKLEVATAMALELMSSPPSWADVAREEADYKQRYREPWPIDGELATLVRRAWPGLALPQGASIWDCYKGIVRGAEAGAASRAALLGALQRSAR